MLQSTNDLNTNLSEGIYEKLDTFYKTNLTIDDYPETPELFEKIGQIELSKNNRDLVHAWSSTDITKEMLNSYHINSEGICSTNGCQLVKISTETGIKKSLTVLPFFQYLEKHENMIEIWETKNNNFIGFKCGSSVLYSRIVIGKYPDLNSLMREKVVSYSFNKKNYIDGLNAIKKTVKKDSHLYEINFIDMKLVRKFGEENEYTMIKDLIKVYPETNQNKITYLFMPVKIKDKESSLERQLFSVETTKTLTYLDTNVLTFELSGVYNAITVRA
jgi:hypothetical protein